MSESLKTKYDILGILRDVTLSGIEAFGYGNFSFMEFGQASFQSADGFDGYILANFVRNRRITWVSGKYENGPGGALLGKDEWIDEQHWQIHVVLKRKGGSPPSGETAVAEDVATNLITWLNGRGVPLLRAKGVAPLVVDASRVFTYNDDSWIYQKRAVFTVKIQVPKEFKYEQKPMDIAKPSVLPI